MSLLKPECLKVAKVTKEEVIALQKLKDGEATPYEQKLALHVITNKFSRTHDLCYVPDSPDQTTFLNGRAFVGTRILHYINIPVGKLDEVDNENS